jgi:hypothetical protein
MQAGQCICSEVSYSLKHHKRLGRPSPLHEFGRGVNMAIVTTNQLLQLKCDDKTRERGCQEKSASY